MRRPRKAKGVTHAEMEKGFFYSPFTSPPVPASSFSFAPSLPSLFTPSAPSLDVLKGHVKYSGGIFITVLSGNARGLISLFARGRRAKWIAKREIECIRLPVCLFLFHPFWLRQGYCIISIKFTHNTRARLFFSVIIRKTSFFAGLAFAAECSSNAKLIPTVVNGWFPSRLFHLNWLSCEVSK